MIWEAARSQIEVRPRKKGFPFHWHHSSTVGSFVGPQFENRPARGVISPCRVWRRKRPFIANQLSVCRCRSTRNAMLRRLPPNLQRSVARKLITSHFSSMTASPSFTITYVSLEYRLREWMSIFGTRKRRMTHDCLWPNANATTVS